MAETDYSLTPQIWEFDVPKIKSQPKTDFEIITEGPGIKLGGKLIPGKDKVDVYLLNDGEQTVTIRDLKITSLAQNFWCTDNNVDEKQEDFSLKPQEEAKLGAVTYCIIRAGVNFAIGSANVKTVHSEDQFCSLIEDLEKALEDLNFTDWIFSCEGKQLRCHRMMLAARSPVFKKMMSQSGFVENEVNETVFEDMSFETLQALMKFVYTNKIDEKLSTGNVMELFVSADKYYIPDLQKRCEVILGENIDIQNAALLFQFSLLHQIETLKEKSIRFIAKNFRSVKLTDGWRKLKEDLEATQSLEELIAFVCDQNQTRHEHSKPN